MRAARRDALVSTRQPSSNPPVPQTSLVFPEYISHCELWSAAEDEDADTSVIQPRAPRRETGDRIVEIASRRESQRGSRAITAGRERYVFSVATLMIAVLIAAGAAIRPNSGNSSISMMASWQRTLVAGSPAWNEIADDDVLKDAPTVRNSARRRIPRISPEQLENEVRDLLASNGFPDIGVSASRRGEVYLAGRVFSSAEVDSIVRIANLAQHARRVFFLHPEVREAEGKAFLGATAEYAPEVWGARIRSVIIGSPAYKAGIRIGDVIREFDNAAVTNASDLGKALAQHKPGERVSIRIWRDGAIRYRIARLEPLPQYALR